MTLSRKSLQLLVLGFLGWLILWNGSWEFRPSMDAMTYGALARHVLDTGDWKRLHYAAQAYADFFQHPPLAIWLTAIVFQLAGISDFTQKLLPSLFALLSVACVVVWGYRWRSSWWGFLAGLVLLSSVRFTKYSVGFMLDPFLAAFMVWAVFFARWAIEYRFRDQKKQLSIVTVASGFMLAGAFLSKGMPALAAAGVVFLVLLSEARRDPRKFSWSVVGVTLGAGVPLTLWLTLGGGATYLVRYWQESVANRIGGAGWMDQLAPSKNLLTVYWPWLPFWLWGLVQSLRQLQKKGLLSWLQHPVTPGVLGSLAVLGGFSASGRFYEHYLVPFYPFAALVVADQIAKPLERFHLRILQFLFWLSVVYAMLLATLPLHVQGKEYLNPIRNLLRRAPQECSNSGVVKRLHFSEKGEIWAALAAGLWYTPWDVYAGPATLGPEATGSQLLLAPVNEPVHPDWIPTSLIEQGFRIYQMKGQMKGLEACPAVLP